jgi:SprT protein
MSNRERANQAIQNTLRVAKRLYGFNEYVEVEFRNTGRCAGWASYDRGLYKLAFNSQLLEREDWMNDLITDTIPHEIAHLVCYYDRSLGKNHDKGWKRVCISLGGSGSRTHSLEVKKARRSRKAIYHINNRTVEIGINMHKKIQDGKRYHMRSCQTAIRPSDFTGQIVMS